MRARGPTSTSSAGPTPTDAPPTKTPRSPTGGHHPTSAPHARQSSAAPAPRGDVPPSSSAPHSKSIGARMFEVLGLVTAVEVGRMNGEQLGKVAQHLGAHESVWKNPALMVENMVHIRKIFDTDASFEKLLKLHPQHFFDTLTYQAHSSPQTGAGQSARYSAANGPDSFSAGRSKAPQPAPAEGRSYAEPAPRRSAGSEPGGARPSAPTGAAAALPPPAPQEASRQDLLKFVLGDKWTAKTGDDPSYRILLGLHPTADVDKKDATRAYRRLILKVHPDKNLPGSPNHAVANQAFSLVNIAWQKMQTELR